MNSRQVKAIFKPFITEVIKHSLKQRRVQSPRLASGLISLWPILSLSFFLYLFIEV